MNATLPWLDARRAKAVELFHAKGMPHRRIEEWKYTDLRAVLAEDEAAAGAAAWRIATLPKGVELFDLAAAQDAPDWVRAHLGTKLAANAMSAASFAFARSGLALRMKRGLAVETLALEFSGAGPLHALVVLEEGASLTIVETHRGNENQLRNIGMEIVLGANTALTHVRIAPEAPAALHVEEIALTAARDSRYHAHFASFGARLSRLELHIALEGEGAEAHLSGVSVLGGATHADITTYVDHAVGRTQSTQLFRKVAGGKSRAIYQGKVKVAPGAIGSDSRQTAKGLLLGARAEIDLKPELEILTDDVKCAHGAAVGDLDAESLFYLRSRGIPEAEARNLLVHAFLEDVTAQIADEDIRLQVWKAVEAALPHAMRSES